MSLTWERSCLMFLPHTLSKMEQAKELNNWFFLRVCWRNRGTDGCQKWQFDDRAEDYCPSVLGLKTYLEPSASFICFWLRPWFLKLVNAGFFFFFFKQSNRTCYKKAWPQHVYQSISCPVGKVLSWLRDWRKWKERVKGRESGRHFLFVSLWAWWEEQIWTPPAVTSLIWDCLEGSGLQKVFSPSSCCVLHVFMPAPGHVSLRLYIPPFQSLEFLMLKE